MATARTCKKCTPRFSGKNRNRASGLEPLSLWLIGIYALAIFFGGAYLGRFSGSFSGDSLDPGTIPDQVARAWPRWRWTATDSRSLPPPSAAKKFLWRIARFAINRRTRIAKPGLSAACRF